MADLMDKMSQIAKKVEQNQKAIITLTPEENRLMKEIEAQVQVLEGLNTEFEEALIESEDYQPTTFRFPVVEEDEDNMEIEKLAEVLKFENADNDDMIAACTTFVAEHATTTIQRVYRGHIGRRKFKIKKDIEWAKEAERTAVIMQAAYRGMVGRRAARAYHEAYLEGERRNASVQVQRMVRGNKERKLVQAMRKEVHRVNKEFFTSRGLSEASLFRKRNHIANADDSPESSSSDSDDDVNYLPTRHPTTGKRLEAAPQYGAKLKETHRDFHHPHTRWPKEDSFQSNSSDEEDNDVG